MQILVTECPINYGQCIPDDDLFGSCHECGNTMPIYTTHYESEIKDSLETVRDPFESNESVFLSIDSRATQRKKGKKPISNRFRTIRDL